MSNNYSVHPADQLVRLSLFTAIILLQSWVPFLGNIYTPVLSITIIQITVVVATLWMGLKAGLWLGFVWGLNSWIRAFVVPTPLQQVVFVSPLVSVLPRLLMPIALAGIIYLMKKMHWSPTIIATLSGIMGSFLNSFFTLGAMALFKYEAINQFALGNAHVSATALLISILSMNAVPEIIASAILTPILDRAIGRNFVHHE